MEHFNRDVAVQRFIDWVTTDETTRQRYRSVIEDDFSEGTDFLRHDLGMVLEAYANQRTEPSNKMPNAVWPCIDHSEFKADIPRVAYRYLSLTELHSDRFSDFLCRALLDSEIYPLAREMEHPRSILPAAIGHVAAYNLEANEKGSAFATIGAVLLLLAAIYLGALAAYLPAILAGGVAIWIFATKSRNRKAVANALGEISVGLRAAHGRLTQIRDEISRGTYEPTTIVSRLKAAEAESVYVPSIIYSVLAVRSGSARK
jgi:hypothetical protein